MKQRFNPAPELVTRRIAGQTVIVPVARGMADLDSVFTLNETGSVIWDGLSRGCDEPELVRVVADTFEVDEHEAVEDVRTFLRQLEGAGLISRAGEE